MQLYTVHWIVSALEWLDDWPVGLKLNTPLSRFFRVGCTTIVEWWGGEFMSLIRCLVLMASYSSADSTIPLVNISPRHIIKWIWRFHPLPGHSERCHGASHPSPSYLPRNHLTACQMAAE
jgi:hypothetical protein